MNVNNRDMNELSEITFVRFSLSDGVRSVNHWKLNQLQHSRPQYTHQYQPDIPFQGASCSMMFMSNQFKIYIGI
jgi:hypothetical protein